MLSRNSGEALPKRGSSPGNTETDREIDALVYELYGLSDAEIRLVEEATAR